MAFEYLMSFDSGQSLAEAWDNEYSMSGPQGNDSNYNRANDLVRGYSWDVISDDSANGGPPAPFSGAGFLKLYRHVNDGPALQNQSKPGNRVEISSATNLESDMEGNVTIDNVVHSNVSEVWYTVKMFQRSGDDLLAPGDYPDDFGGHYIFQLHGDRTVLLTVDQRDDGLYMVVNAYSGTQENPKFVSNKPFVLADDFPRDRWVDLTIRIAFDHNGGLVDAYIDKVLLASFRAGIGGTLGAANSNAINLGLAADKRVYFKTGSYMNGDTQEQTRTVYIDSVRVADTPPVGFEGGETPSTPAPATTPPTDPGSIPDSPNPFDIYTTIQPTPGITERAADWDLNQAINFTEGFFTKTGDTLDWDAAKLLTNLDRYVTPAYSGLLIIDWETPFWILKDSSNAQYQAMIAKFVAIAQYVKDQRPSAQVGFYGLPFSDYWPIYGEVEPIDGTLRDAPVYQAAQEALEDIFSAVDVIAPTCYDFYVDATYGSARDVAIFSEVIRVATLVSNGKPVIPFIWDRYHDGGSSNPRRFETIDEEEFKRQVRTILDVKVGEDRADGLLVWGADNWFYPTAHADGRNDAWASNIRRVFAEESAGYSSIEAYIEARAITTFERVFDVVQEYADPVFDNRRPVIISTDTKNEVDDYFAIFRALFEPSFNVLGLHGAHYSASGASGIFSGQLSHEANVEILEASGLTDAVPAKQGSNGPMPNPTTPVVSDSSNHIVQIANAVGLGQVLDIIILGSLTDVASAILQDPEIIPKLRLHCMMMNFNGTELSSNEFNCNHDQHAVTAVLDSGVEMHIMPGETSGNLVFQKSTLHANLRETCSIHSYLETTFDDYLASINGSGLTQWTMWDITIVEVMAAPYLGTLTTVNTASLDGSNPHTARDVRVYNSINHVEMQNVYWSFMDTVCEPVEEDRTDEPPSTVLINEPFNYDDLPSLQNVWAVHGVAPELTFNSALGSNAVCSKLGPSGSVEGRSELTWKGGLTHPHGKLRLLELETVVEDFDLTVWNRLIQINAVPNGGDWTAVPGRNPLTVVIDSEGKYRVHIIKTPGTGTGNALADRLDWSRDLVVGQRLYWRFLFRLSDGSAGQTKIWCGDSKDNFELVYESLNAGNIDTYDSQGELAFNGSFLRFGVYKNANDAGSQEVCFDNIRLIENPSIDDPSQQPSVAALTNARAISIDGSNATLRVDTDKPLEGVLYWVATSQLAANQAPTASQVYRGKNYYGQSVSTSGNFPAGSSTVQSIDVTGLTFPARVTFVQLTGDGLSAVASALIGQDQKESVLLVSSNIGADTVIANRLELLGYGVTHVSASEALDNDLSDIDLVIIAESVRSADIAGAFKAVDVPVIVMDSFLYDDMCMTGSVLDTDYGLTLGVGSVAFTDAAAIGLAYSGATTLHSVNHSQAWGDPSNEATIVATVDGDAAKAAVFFYEQGDLLADGLPASASRIAVPFFNNAADSWTDEGRALFDAVLIKALEAPAPVIGDAVELFIEPTGDMTANVIVRVSGSSGSVAFVATSSMAQPEGFEVKAGLDAQGGVVASDLKDSAVVTAPDDYVLSLAGLSQGQELYVYASHDAGPVSAVHYVHGQVKLHGGVLSLDQTDEGDYCS